MNIYVEKIRHMKTRKYFKSGLMIILVLFLFSCKYDNTNDAIFLPKISGKTGEVLLIIKKEKWDGDLGHAFDTDNSCDSSGQSQSLQPT